jgi:hypothetical protein
MVHVQSRAVSTANVPVPPVDVKDEGELVRLMAHLSAVGAVTDVSVWVHEPHAALAASSPRICETNCVRIGNPRRVMHSSRQLDEQAQLGGR